MYRKPLAIVLSAVLIWTGLVTSAAAAVVGTLDAVSMQTHQQRVAEVQAGVQAGVLASWEAA